MTRFLLARVAQAGLSILLVATAVFFLVRLTGDPTKILLPEFAPPEFTAQIRERLGLDGPLYQQYLAFLGSLVRLDLGESFSGRPVVTVLMERMPATLSLALAALILSAAIGIPIGILAALKRGTPVDGAGQALALVGQSIPSFWLSIVFILVFAVQLRWFPAAGRTGLSSHVLPAMAMGFVSLAGFIRLTRSSMLDVMQRDYIRMARAKGLPPAVVSLKHGLRNALIPVLTFAGLVVGTFLNGSVVVESIFAWPGIGDLSLSAVSRRDFPVVQGAVIMFATFYIVINLLVDVAYALLDPRVRVRS